MRTHWRISSILVYQIWLEEGGSVSVQGTKWCGVRMDVTRKPLRGSSDKTWWEFEVTADMDRRPHIWGYLEDRISGSWWPIGRGDISVDSWVSSYRRRAYMNRTDRREPRLRGESNESNYEHAWFEAPISGDVQEKQFWNWGSRPRKKGPGVKQSFWDVCSRQHRNDWLTFREVGEVRRNSKQGSGERQCLQDDVEERGDKGTEKDLSRKWEQNASNRETPFKMERIMLNQEHFWVFCGLKKRCHVENRKIKKKNIQFTKSNDD